MAQEFVLLPRAHGVSPRRLSAHPQQRRGAAACRRAGAKQRHIIGPRPVGPRGVGGGGPGSRKRRVVHHKRRRSQVARIFPGTPVIFVNSPHAKQPRRIKSRRSVPRHLAWWQKKHSAAWWKHYWATHTKKAPSCPKHWVPFGVWLCTHPFKAQSAAAARRAQRGRSAKPSGKASGAARKPIKCSPPSRKRR